MQCPNCGNPIHAAIDPGERIIHALRKYLHIVCTAQCDVIAIKLINQHWPPRGTVWAGQGEVQRAIALRWKIACHVAMQHQCQRLFMPSVNDTGTRFTEARMSQRHDVSKVHQASDCFNLTFNNDPAPSVAGAHGQSDAKSLLTVCRAK